MKKISWQTIFVSQELSVKGLATERAPGSSLAVPIKMGFRSLVIDILAVSSESDCASPSQASPLPVVPSG